MGKYKDEVGIDRAYCDCPTYSTLAKMMRASENAFGWKNTVEEFYLYFADLIEIMVMKRDVKNLVATVARVELALRPAGYRLIKDKKVEDVIKETEMHLIALCPEHWWNWNFKG